MLDLAEIPTFQARQAAASTPTSTSRRIAANLHLTVDGKPARLVPVAHELAFPPGQGGLAHDAARGAPRAGRQLDGAARLAYRDGNYAGRIGWKEIVVRPSAGARLPRSSAPATASATGCSPIRRTCSRARST